MESRMTTHNKERDLWLFLCEREENNSFGEERRAQEICGVLDPVRFMTKHHYSTVYPGRVNTPTFNNSDILRLGLYSAALSI
jgi:hypothetical protein